MFAKCLSCFIVSFVLQILVIRISAEDMSNVPEIQSIISKISEFRTNFSSFKIPADDVPSLPPKTDLDVSKLVGDWYTDRFIIPSELQGAIHAFPIVCAHTVMTPDGDNYKINYTVLFKYGNVVNKEKTLLQKAPGVLEDQNDHTLETVVDTDYLNYQVTSQNQEDGGLRISILRRNQSEPLAQDVIDKIYTILKAANVDVSKFILTEETVETQTC